MSGNLSTKFHVTNINNDFTELYGWTKHDVMDQNIKAKIMPKFISSIHDSLVDHYI